VLCLNFIVPLELSVMRKEYFNRWYSLSTYYISVTLVDLPVQVNIIFIYLFVFYKNKLSV